MYHMSSFRAQARVDFVLDSSCKMTGFKLDPLLRAVLFTTLLCCLLAYFWSSLSKYRAGRIGVTSTEVVQTLFHPPAVQVCGKVGEFQPADRFHSWISKVEYRYATSTKEEEVL